MLIAFIYILFNHLHLFTVFRFRNILLNYAVYNPDMGYTQGMSDLLSPLLSTIQDEVDTFWCFVGLMEFSLFATTPTDTSMDRSLVHPFVLSLCHIYHFIIHYFEYFLSFLYF